MTRDGSGGLVGPSFREILDVVLRGLPWGVFLGLLLGAGVWFWASNQPTVYRASATVLTSHATQTSDIGATFTGPGALDALGYATALMSDAVITDAMELLGFSDPTPAQVTSFRRRTNVNSEETRNTTVLRIAFEDSSATRAAESATALARALGAWDAERVGRGMQRAISTLQVELAALDSRLAMLVDANAVPMSVPEYQDVINLRTQRQTQLVSALALAEAATGSLEITQPAVVPEVPIQPRPLLMALAAFVLGVLLAYAGVLVRQHGDRRLRFASDLTRLTGVAPLVQFNGSDGAEGFIGPNSYLRARLGFHDSVTNGGALVVLVTSAREYAGQDRIAIGLANSYMHSGARTLLIDADLHEHRVTHRLRVNEEESTELVAYLKQPEIAETIPPLGSRHRPLSVVPSFVDALRSADLLTRGFNACLDVWRREFDVIVISAPPLLPVADAVVLAPQSDRVVLSVALGPTLREHAVEASELLERIVPGKWGTVTTSRHGREQGGAASRRRTRPAGARGALADAADGPAT